jgi:hypothetical protein
MSGGLLFPYMPSWHDDFAITFASIYVLQFGNPSHQFTHSSDLMRTEFCSIFMSNPLDVLVPPFLNVFVVTIITITMTIMIITICAN